MAPPAGDTAHNRARRLLRLLLPFPGRLEFSIRLALICALTALVAEIYQTPDPALTVYVAFFLIKPDRVTSIILSLVMLLVLTVTLLIVLSATIMVVDEPILRVGAMTLLSFGLIFLASASKLRPITPIMALITAYALDLLGTVQAGEVATRALLYAWLFVGIPAGMSILVNLIGGPPPRRLAERALARRLRLTAAILREPEHRTRHQFEGVLREGIGEILTWLKLSGVEKTSPAADLAALRQAADSTLQIMLLADMASRVQGRFLPPASSALLAEKLDAMAAILAAGSWPVEIAPLPETASVSAEAASWQVEMDDVLAHFATPPSPAAKSGPGKKLSGGFLAADAFTNPAHVHHALKTTGAAMFCYVLYSLLDWPAIHTCLITCYIVALGTAAETVEKLSLRILGCLLGAAAGIAAIVFLVPDLTSIGSLMITVFLAALASAWVAGGDVRISYAGFQIGFAFFLCVLQGSGPSFDMVTARDRVIGILLGNIVTYLVFTNIWPVSVAERLDPAIATLLRNWSSLLRASRQAAILAVSPALTTLGRLERDLDLIAYEPAPIRPSGAWLADRRRGVAGLASLAGVFWLCARTDPGLSKDASAHLDRLAGLIDGQDTQALPEESEPPTLDGLRSLVETHLLEIESSLTDHPTEHRTALVHAPT